MRLVEFGCGYGYFTLPAAHIAKGLVFAFDVESEMVTTTGRKTHEEGFGNGSVNLKPASSLPGVSSELSVLSYKECESPSSEATLTIRDMPRMAQPHCANGTNCSSWAS